MGKVYWDSIKKGDLIPPLSKPAVSKVQISKLAGALEDHHGFHTDDDFAKSAGFGGVFAHNLLALGYADEALRQFASNARIVSLSGTFQKLIWPGDVLTAKGKIIKHYKENEEPRIDIEIWTENQNRDMVMKGLATCILWENQKAEKKSEHEQPPFASALSKRVKN